MQWNKNIRITIGIEKIERLSLQDFTYNIPWNFLKPFKTFYQLGIPQIFYKNLLAKPLKSFCQLGVLELSTN